MHGKREYRSWRSMKQRCLCPADPFFHRYGGRGIKVCERWLVFENFYEDMGARPPGHVLDRRDNNGDYTPENCRWVPQKVNQRNRSSNTLLTHEGQTLPLTTWAEKLGINPETLSTRLGKLGWPVERALTQPLRGRNK